MSPTVRHGDIVVVDPRDLNLFEGMHVIRDGFGACVDRLQHGDGRLRLTCDNNIYSCHEVSLDELMLIGRVVGCLSRL